MVVEIHLAELQARTPPRMKGNRVLVSLRPAHLVADFQAVHPVEVLPVGGLPVGAFLEVLRVVVQGGEVFRGEPLAVVPREETDSQP